MPLGLRKVWRDTGWPSLVCPQMTEWMGDGVMMVLRKDGVRAVEVIHGFLRKVRKNF